MITRASPMTQESLIWHHPISRYAIPLTMGVENGWKASPHDSILCSSLFHWYTGLAHCPQVGTSFGREVQTVGNIYTARKWRLQLGLPADHLGLSANGVPLNLIIYHNVSSFSHLSLFKWPKKLWAKIMGPINLWIFFPGPQHMELPRIPQLGRCGEIPPI